MSTYDAGANTRKWWVYRAIGGNWVASPPVTAGLHVEVFPTHREAMDHYIRHQRSLAATRLARMLAGVTS